VPVTDVYRRLGVTNADDVTIANVVRAHIERVLEASRGSKSTAARVLGMHRRTLQRFVSKGAPSSAVGFFSFLRPSELRSEKRNVNMPGEQLEARIQQVIKDATKSIVEIVTADIAAQLQRVLGAQPNGGRGNRTPSRKARKAATPENVAASKSGNKKPGRAGRRGSIDEATMTRVLEVIEANPGLRSEEIYKKLPLPVELARKALTKLRETERVKTKGEKRSMTYAAA
jgi:hypothetical protein